MTNTLAEMNQLVASADGIVVEQTCLGTDFRRVCYRHQWASPPHPDRRRLPDCPICEAERDCTLGRKRYQELHQRFATEG